MSKNIVPFLGNFWEKIPFFWEKMKNDIFEKMKNPKYLGKNPKKIPNLEMQESLILLGLEALFSQIPKNLLMLTI